jgi:hypothetical protein
VSSSGSQWLQKGAHNETDKVRGMGKHVTKTKKDQDRTLERYIQQDLELPACYLWGVHSDLILSNRWQMRAMRQDYAQKGLPAPDEDATRSKYLGQGVAAPELALSKTFSGSTSPRANLSSMIST